MHVRPAVDQQAFTQGSEGLDSTDQIPHYLPPYSPELNPVERLWAYIKQRAIKSKVYQTISALEDTIAHFITTLELTTVASICKLDYF